MHLPLALNLKGNPEYYVIVRKYESAQCLTLGSYRDTLRDLVNMAEDVGRKWDRCLADTAVKTG